MTTKVKIKIKTKKTNKEKLFNLNDSTQIEMRDGMKKKMKHIVVPNEDEMKMKNRWEITYNNKYYKSNNKDGNYNNYTDPTATLG